MFAWRADQHWWVWSDLWYTLYMHNMNCNRNSLIKLTVRKIKIGKYSIEFTWLLINHWWHHHRWLLLMILWINGVRWRMWICCRLVVIHFIIIYHLVNYSQCSTLYFRMFLATNRTKLWFELNRKKFLSFGRSLCVFFVVLSYRLAQDRITYNIEFSLYIHMIVASCAF